MAVLTTVSIAAQKKFSSGACPDDHWIKSNAYPTELPWHVPVSLRLLDP